jgi:hypothetical protein
MMEKTKIYLLTFLCFSMVPLCMPMTVFADVKTQDFIENLNIKGDLRVRYDYQDNDDGKDDAKDRLRARFRLGLVWQNPMENWTVAAGLATGGLDGNTTNATYSEEQIFETGDIRLDYAYAEHKLDNLTLIAGQHKNKFYSSMALWDGDVRPAGFTGQIKFDSLFVTAGYFQVRYTGRDIARMAATQMGVDTGDLVAAIGYYDVNRVDEFLDVENLDPDYKYQIIDFYTQCTIHTDSVSITPLAHIFYNAGAKGNPGQSVGGENLDPEDTAQNLGWLVGAKAKVDKFNFGIEYGEVGADAAIQDIKDSDWGSGLGSTDIKGWKAAVGYKLTKHCAFETTYFYTEPKERKEYAVKDVNRVQVDLKYKF